MNQALTVEDFKDYIIKSTIVTEYVGKINKSLNICVAVSDNSIEYRIMKEHELYKTVFCLQSAIRVYNSI